jgi:hypothetical protein
VHDREHQPKADAQNEQSAINSIFELPFHARLLKHPRLAKSCLSLRYGARDLTQATAK